MCLISKLRNERVNMPRQLLKTGMNAVTSRPSMTRVRRLQIEKKYGVYGRKDCGTKASSFILRIRWRVWGRSPRRSTSANLSRLSEPLLDRFRRDLMDRPFNFRFRAGLRKSQPPIRGRAELCIILHVREQAFNDGRSSDRHRRISSTSSGGSRFHPLARSVVGGVRHGLGFDLAGKSFFKS